MRIYELKSVADALQWSQSFVSRGSITLRDTESLPRGTGENPISEPVRTARLASLVVVPTWKCECYDLVACLFWAMTLPHSHFHIGTNTKVTGDVQRGLLVAVPMVKPLDLPEQKKIPIQSTNVSPGVISHVSD